MTPMAPMPSHSSDCAMHNAPALEPAPCDCRSEGIPMAVMEGGTFPTFDKRISNAQIAREIADIADQLPPELLRAAIVEYLQEVR